jgi:hypothetical protein
MVRLENGWVPTPVEGVNAPAASPVVCVTVFQSDSLRYFAACRRLFQQIVDQGLVRFILIPVRGRPTPGAPLSSASVDAGISEKPIASAEVRFSLFRARAACADGPDRFLVISASPPCTNQNKNSSSS